VDDWPWGQAVRFSFDAIPDRQFTGRLEQIGTIASLRLQWRMAISAELNLRFALDQQDPRLKARPNCSSNRGWWTGFPMQLRFRCRAMIQKSGQIRGLRMGWHKISRATDRDWADEPDRVLVAKGLNLGTA